MGQLENAVGQIGKGLLMLAIIIIVRGRSRFSSILCRAADACMVVQTKERLLGIWRASGRFERAKKEQCEVDKEREGDGHRQKRPKV